MAAEQRILASNGMTKAPEGRQRWRASRSGPQVLPPSPAKSRGAMSRQREKTIHEKRHWRTMVARLADVELGFTDQPRRGAGAAASGGTVRAATRP